MPFLHIADLLLGKPEYERPKKTGEGVATQAANASLENLRFETALCHFTIHAGLRFARDADREVGRRIHERLHL